MKNPENFRPLAQAALELIGNDCVIGLGSGRTANAFTQALAERVRGGMRVRGVATSKKTAALAIQLGIPLVNLDEVEAIDVTVDGADEVDPELNLIKGLGGALVREKILASASARLIILVDSGKLVSALGEHGVLPVEVVPFGLAFVCRRLSRLGYPPTLRKMNGELFVSDNGNYILDCRVPALQNPLETEQTLREIPGVVGTGLFLGMAHTVLVQDGNEIQVRRRREK
jgi:ribose 5-phosphate isomerase A